MLASSLQLVIGLALIIQGGNLFVAAAVRIAEFLRMPRIVIGSTLVSLATTSPELVVSLMSGLKGESGLAVGNAVGSCVCNLGLILGVTAALKRVEVEPRSLRTPLAAMLGFGLLLLVLSLDLTVSRVQGWGLVLAGLGYFAWDFLSHWRRSTRAERREAAVIEREIAGTGRGWFQTRPGTAVQFAGGAAIVAVGSRFLVDGAVSVAGQLGVPSMVIGLTVIAVGTSLPELITAVTSSRESASDLAVGNVLGANIANLSLIVGAAAVLTPVRLDRWTQVFSFPAMLVMMAAFLWMLLRNRGLSRTSGVLLLSGYGLYLVALVMLNVLGPG